MVPGGVPFPLLSDAGGRVGEVYGVYDEAAGVDIRGRFIIDPNFVIRAMEVLTPEVGRNVSELIRQVKAFQHVVATGEVTPSGWQPGKPTLTPVPGPSWQGLEAMEAGQCFLIFSYLIQKNLSVDERQPFFTVK